MHPTLTPRDEIDADEQTHVCRADQHAVRDSRRADRIAPTLLSLLEDRLIDQRQALTPQRLAVRSVNRDQAELIVLVRRRFIERKQLTHHEELLIHDDRRSKELHTATAIPQLARRDQTVQRPRRPHRPRCGRLACTDFNRDPRLNRQRHQLCQHIEIALPQIFVDVLIMRPLSLGRQNVDREHTPSIARKRAASGVRCPSISHRVDTVVLTGLSRNARQPLAHRKR